MSYGVSLKIQEHGKGYESNYNYHIDTVEGVKSLISDSLAYALNNQANVNHVTVIQGQAVLLSENVYGNRISLASL